jgi:transglutaminase-like putative cysteine protease
MKRHLARYVLPALLVFAFAGCTSMNSISEGAVNDVAKSSGSGSSIFDKLGSPFGELAQEMLLSQCFADVPARYRDQAWTNLKSYYGYKEVRTWLIHEESHEPAKCVAFLFAYLPPVDYGALTPELLREHVEYSLKVRAEAPWREQLTDELFYHYILAHRVSQEPCQAWRKLMHDELWPRVKDLPMQEAALEANRYAREYATFAQTNARDQGPLTTMLRGVGRCEEEMILYICAARSIGIPARPCHTPYWTFTDNNHAWCEAYADGRWWFLGGCEPDTELDRGWFAQPAARAGLVVSVAYGDVADSKESVYARRTGVTFINSTPVYGDTCEVSATSSAAITSEVWVHIFNFGSLRQIARFAADKTIVLGRGDYVLTALTKDGPVAGLARTWDDKAATPDVLEKTVCRLSADGWKTLILGEPRRILGSSQEDAPTISHNWLRFPNAPRRSTGRGSVGAQHAAPAQKQLTPEQKHALVKASAERTRARDQWRRERSKLTPEDEKLINALPGDYPERARRQLARCGANTPEAMVALRGLSSGMRCICIDYLETCDEKDCFEFSGDIVIKWVRGVHSIRTADGEPYKKFLLPTRVLNEPWPRWFERDLLKPSLVVLPEARAPGDDSPPYDWFTPEFVRALNEAFAKQVKEVDRTFFGSVGTLSQIYCARRANKTDAGAALVSLYRYFGLASRLAPASQLAEVYLKEHWTPVYPFEPENFGKVKPEAEALYAAPGEVDISFTRDGGWVPDVQPWRDYMLCRVDKGWVEPMEEIDWKPGERGPSAKLQPGDYVLFTGARSGRGDVCFRSVRVHIESKQTTRIVADCSLVREELDAVELASRKLAAWPEAKVTAADSKLVSLKEIVGDKPTLVVLLNTSEEPARRLLALLAPMQDELQKRGINIAAIYVGKEGREDWQKISTEAGVSITLYDDADQTLFKEIGATEQPAVIMLTPQCETLLWHEGYALHVPQLIKAAMKWVK